MPTPYDEILGKYKIPKKKLDDILIDPVNTYRNLHKSKEGVLALLKKYYEILQDHSYSARQKEVLEAINVIQNTGRGRKRKAGRRVNSTDLDEIELAF